MDEDDVLFPDLACPICGAPNYSCNFLHGIALAATGIAKRPDGALVAEQLPATAANRAALRATQIQATLPSGQFTTGTYRGNPPRRPKRRP
jgi:hypothetical protein